MLHKHALRERLGGFFETTGLVSSGNKMGIDREKKIEQIIAFLEVIDSQIRKYSKKRELVFIESCAGNSRLSFLVYYYYNFIDPRPIRIHCVDIEKKLMDKNRLKAANMHFENMHFHTSDILDYEHTGGVDVVYTLHACDTATDKAMFLGSRLKAKNILSVSCCQHTIKKQQRSNSITSAITRHSIYKDKMAYMVGDSMRALLLGMNGYEVDIIEFVSARATDKNILVRAKRGQPRAPELLRQEYSNLQRAFRITPALENYLNIQSDKYIECSLNYSQELTFA